MLTSMTQAEIQTKYSGIHTPEEIDQFHQNMKNSNKWKVVKNEWTWDGLNHVQLRGRALQYHPSLDMMELYKEHPYKTALRLVRKEEHLEDSENRFPGLRGVERLWSVNQTTNKSHADSQRANAYSVLHPEHQDRDFDLFDFGGDDRIVEVSFGFGDSEEAAEVQARTSGLH